MASTSRDKGPSRAQKPASGAGDASANMMANTSPYSTTPSAMGGEQKSGNSDDWRCGAASASFDRRRGGMLMAQGSM
ncbi:hypothetical protein [Thiohalocapsa sp. ML1]|uniref:hypothetical protein n=1 Tax=Thiohalocapsa sp. ML1 TaxID=1431688 RepID=UPI001C1FEC23|nr:hypothetical protein [Thiohalocapsa sp. ML1]